MQKFGLLIHSTENLGDDIQSLAARQFLPSVDQYVDRDYLDKNVPKDISLKVIMNGWFSHRFQSWPPPQNLEPLFISFHIWRWTQWVGQPDGMDKL